MTLLDGVAAWLDLFEVDDPAIAAETGMLADCGAPAGSRPITKRKVTAR